MRQIGQRVKIMSGMKEFIGSTGTISDNSEKDGSTVMYRVRLDKAVDVPGVGRVEDDLWSGKFLKTIRSVSWRELNDQM